MGKSGNNLAPHLLALEWEFSLWQQPSCACVESRSVSLNTGIGMRSFQDGRSGFTHAQNVAFVLGVIAFIAIVYPRLRRKSMGMRGDNQWASASLQ